MGVPWLASTTLCGVAGAEPAEVASASGPAHATLVAAPDGQSVYVGGRFNKVDGVTQLKLARLATSDGRPLPFRAEVNAVVTALAVNGDRLYVGGVFQQIQGRQRRLAALDLNTGIIDDNVAVNIAGVHRTGGDGKIWRIEASPDGRPLVVVGSFATVDGQPSNQIVKLDTNSGGVMTIEPWSTTALSGCCASFQDYVRDVSYSPDGSYASASTDPDGTVAPAGWDRVLDGTTAKSRSAVFARTATEDDAGTVIDVTTSVYARTDVVLAAYRGLALQLGGQTAVQGYTTPSRNATPGAWVLSYWGDKTATTTSWGAPPEVTVRHSFAGSGPGHVSEMLADNVATADGPTPGLTATVDQPSAQAIATTVVLYPT
ncbi:hypothetical protein BH24ACT4_BH24ACT4_12110 [soil metagenome]